MFYQLIRLYLQINNQAVEYKLLKLDSSTYSIAIFYKHTVRLPKVKHCIYRQLLFTDNERKTLFFYL